MIRFTSNIDTLIQRLQQAAQQGEVVDVSAALVTGVNAAMGKMKFRIFNASLDANGEPLGKYTGKRTKVTGSRYKAKRYGSEENEQAKTKKRANIKDSIAGEALTEYEKERLAHGRQIQHKDLEFTGALRRSIVLVTTSPTKVICLINNKQQRLIADGQEKQIAHIRGTGSKVPIFTLSKEEAAEMRINITNAITELYARVFNT